MYILKINIMEHFIMGAISGSTGILLSHPIDTIKTNVQDGKKISFNPRFLYRGIIPPFLGMGLEKAIVFGTYHNVSEKLKTIGLDSESHDHMDRILAGSIAGFVSSFVVTPIERLKILSQTGNDKMYKNILRDRKLYLGLFKGLSTTFTREMPGFAIYFSTYENLKEIISIKKEVNMLDHFYMGGLSGLVSWSFIYPQDLIKTKIQASVGNHNTKDIIKNIYSEYGFRGFFKGFHLALLRSVPLHAGTFAMYEYLSNKI
jgi:solute carrier family 25 carnitine/acylcarnitine transporter 20/29